jgi:AcrR family transcriptional regulator
MSEAKTIGPRPYHHGDLTRALVDAARRLLEAEGPSALSLRAVAREAGVSPAAPYHHFKDKAELLDAVASVGWDLLGAQMSAAKAATTGMQQLTALGIAYVCFARDNPALYHVMYDAARDKDEMPEGVQGNKDSAYCMVRDTMIENGAGVAAWCGAHGLAEMASFKQFDHLKAELGGEVPFFEAVLSHMGLFPKPHHDC